MVNYVVKIILSDVSKDHSAFVKQSKNKYVYTYTPATFLLDLLYYSPLPLSMAARVLSRQRNLKFRFSALALHLSSSTFDCS